MKRLAVLALAGLLASAGTAPAAVDPGKVQEAIKKGADYLKRFKPGAGTGGGLAAGQHAAGLASLTGLALLEAGVPHTDPAVAGIIEFVRVAAYSQTQTYDISLMIVLLDRLNDPTDVPLIQLLGCRLLAGQNAVGGWGYAAWTAGGDAEAFRKAVGAKDPKLIRPEPRPDPNAAPPPPPKLHPEAEKVYRAVRAGARAASPTGGIDDNSNTQFAIVGLWVAQRRGVPCGAAFRLIDSRFMRSQSPVDHGWSYAGTVAAGGGSSTPSMTCAGLLGLAVAAAHDAGKLPADRTDVGAAPGQPAKPKDDDPFFNPPENKGGGDPDAPPDEEKEEKKKTNPIRDAAIERSLKALGRLLKSQSAGRGNALGAADPGIGVAGIGNGWGGVGDLYFFWSLERVAVAFGLDTIGDVDWYGWGAEQIIKAQAADGSWTGNYAIEANTAFAILFLAKSNFVSDLSARIKGKVKDPGAAVMTGRVGAPLAAGGSNEAVRTPGAGGPANANPDQGPGGIARIQERTAAEKEADKLVRAKDSEWPTLLRLAKESKGGHYTAGLVGAIAQLEGRRQYQAREALADRLTRMTAETLKRYLTDRDPELRRAAALAIAMKDEKALTRELIERVMDIDESVLRAVKAALKSLTGEDFGPAVGATDEQKEKALNDWLVWYTTVGRGR